MTTPVDQIETVLIPAGAFTMGDGSGNVTASYGYDVFGAVRSGAPGATDRLFTGEQRDADSEMYYLRARYYDPSIGRFLGRDPLPGGNLYAYVGNNPVNFTDPSGLCPRRYLLRPRPIQVVPTKCGHPLRERPSEFCARRLGCLEETSSTKKAESPSF